MTQVISRIYQVHDNAEAAAAALRRAGFTAVSVVAPAEAPHDELLTRIRQAGITGAHADAYADGITRGETLVSVQAPFGAASMATTIMEKHGPTETDLGDQGYEKPPPDPAAPLSSACGWKVLIDDPAPLSSALKWKLLSSRPLTRKADSEFVNDPAPFSRKISAPVLTDRPTILSSRFGWRALWDNPAPLSQRFRWPILSQQQKAPSVRFGMRLASDDPAPLSSRFGWKLLSNDPAPLSRLFGWRVLSDKSPK